MQSANRLLLALRSGKPTFGGWQMLPGANLSRAIAYTPGIDWICVDCEHGNISDDSMHASVAAIAACGVSPVVRVPEGQHWMIKRALDSGAHGILVPLLRSADEAREIVRRSKFPPTGNRGLGSPLAMQAFSVLTPSSANEAAARRKDELSIFQYFREANDSTLVLVQIETAEALADIDAIAAVPGIDVCLIGPFDLGNSIGYPISEDGEIAPELNAAIIRIRNAAKAAGKWTAIYSSSGAAAKQYAEQGFDMVNTMNDYAAIRKVFGEALAAATGST